MDSKVLHLRKSYTPNINTLNFTAIVDYYSVFKNDNFEPNESVANSVVGMRLAFGVPHSSICSECKDYDYKTPDKYNECSDHDKFPVVFTCMNKMTDKLAKENNLKCLGVVRDSQLYVPGAPHIVTAPEVHGAVNIVCDPAFMTNAGIGDTLYYSFNQSDVTYIDMPSQHTVEMFTEAKRDEIFTIDKLMKGNNDKENLISRDEWQYSKQRVGTILGYNKNENIVRVLLNITQP